MKIIFDLDGTIIDSAEGISDSLIYALKSSNIKPIMNFEKEFIGPCLSAILARMTGLQEDDLLLEGTSAKFKKHYDEMGYQKSMIYDGMLNVMKFLYEQNYTLEIVTNKRLKPTLQILNFLGISTYFNNIFCIDSFENINNKAQLLNIALKKNSTYIKSQVVYVGDRFEDYDAAHQNNIRFILASWGYCNETNIPNILLAKKPSDILELVGHIK